jgi:hypothetical protein
MPQVYRRFDPILDPLALAFLPAGHRGPRRGELRPACRIRGKNVALGASGVGWERRSGGGAAQSIEDELAGWDEEPEGEGPAGHQVG